ncbi:MAG: peptidogalycan biosysnthesis protein, partial [Xanthobacteraceae bacterium]
MDSPDITLEAVSSARQIGVADWDACANPTSTCDIERIYNPFVSYAFFDAVEQSGSASARTGWAPRHLVARRDGEIVGLVPCYLKSHSQGEYVFDRGWADA